MPDTARLPVMRAATIAPAGTATLNFAAAMGAGYIRARAGGVGAATIVYFAFGTVAPPLATPGSDRFGIQVNEAVNLDDVDFTDLSFRADAGLGGVIVEVIAFPRPGSSGQGI